MEQTPPAQDGIRHVARTKKVAVMEKFSKKKIVISAENKWPSIVELNRLFFVPKLST